ncbi:hypothetical protein [Pedobacter punctiformis]|uniref:DUF304 domain-containing protein n=1 Tax=Pedobacter punctiformis TaxID=3004097 RepID=A0ABT4L9U8_9SPHI|nr:hypothetical protein [Pedobacter sp. HCMS5-2]MCZ4243584.1 hypothetical protein [Pedobacter sp. HCMS5-2]
MKTYQYLEINPAKGILFALAYITIVVFAASLICGGFYKLADAVNNFGGTKIIGLFTGIVCLLPIFLLIKFLYPKIHISTHDNQLIISRKNHPDKLIGYNDITSIALNAERINTLTLYGTANEILFNIHPFNNPHILNQIAKDITSKSPFQKTTEQKNLFKESYDAIIYRRR